MTVKFEELVMKHAITNNIVWSKRVAPSASAVVKLEYRVEHPVGTSFYVH
jgi:hypothetical protein